MDSTDWIVVTAGAAAIAWVNWYFFVANRSVGRASHGQSAQRATVIVEGGYQPNEIRVAAETPIEITFDRRETASCSEEIVFPDLSMRRFLPAHQKTTLTLPALKPGVYPFTCGMSMLHGKVVVE